MCLHNAMKNTKLVAVITSQSYLTSKSTLPPPETPHPSENQENVSSYSSHICLCLSCYSMTIHALWNEPYTHYFYTLHQWGLHGRSSDTVISLCCYHTQRHSSAHNGELKPLTGASRAITRPFTRSVSLFSSPLACALHNACRDPSSVGLYGRERVHRSLFLLGAFLCHSRAPYPALLPLHWVSATVKAPLLLVRASP